MTQEELAATQGQLSAARDEAAAARDEVAKEVRAREATEDRVAQVETALQELRD